MPKIKINDTEHDVPAGITVMQACQNAGVEIPHFCYHERLSIAGNCRMCLVEMEKSPKPIASCAMPVADGMVIRTDSDVTKKARRAVMEFLLINHPLDCPICDQGGECDLQDQAMAYGFDRSRYLEQKRAVTDKYMGPLIKTFMNRCIHCTRCVRFATEVAGVEELGAVGRGEHMEVTTYITKALSSELSGNVVDLCPVGALTSKPYSFKARPWELTATESIDVLDAVGTNIRLDARANEIMRVLPRLNEDINEEWLADKSRHACDGLKRQRLDVPYLRRDGRLQPVTWDEAFAAIAQKIGSTRSTALAAISGDQADAETMLLLRELWQNLGSPHMDCRQDGAVLDNSQRANYLFNTTIAGIEQADAVLLIGTNPRLEAPILNARLRKRWLQSRLPIGVIGTARDLTYPTQNLGDTPGVLTALLHEQHAFAATLKAAKNPLLVLGMGALTRDDSAAIYQTTLQLARQFGALRDDWNGFNVLHTAAARVAGLDIGFVPSGAGRSVRDIMRGAQQGAIEVVYLLGADEIPMADLGKAFVIYQGHHGDAGAARADVILPGAAYSEKTATYTNTEGRVQRTQRAVFPPGEAREDWKIIRALSAVLGKTLPYETLADVQNRLARVHPAYHPDALETLLPSQLPAFDLRVTPLQDTPLVSPIKNYYMTCPISRASQTMAACTAARVMTKAA